MNKKILLVVVLAATATACVEPPRYDVVVVEEPRPLICRADLRTGEVVCSALARDVADWTVLDAASE